ncbi:ribbon-helix-helix DNA binding domain protein [Gordonia phage Periwinkle]|nr:ribbon-helix-helix DNA binding domain protein [Gordonia phage Periwinkle]
MSIEDNVRLSVNLHPEVAAALKATAERKGLSVTDAVNWAIAVWDHLQSEIENGHEIATVRYGKAYKLVIR